MRTFAAIVIIILFASFLPPDNVVTRFKTVPGFHRAEVKPGSFAAYLQSLPLKPRGAHCLTYNGNVAVTDDNTAAVLDISVGKHDLQQCADAVMRLRGEYLYSKKRYSEISFHFVSGFVCDYTHYANGYRYKDDHWVHLAQKDYSYETFMKYMELVFSYAGTPSLEKELKPVTNPAKLKAGDVFIHGGRPGHCFIVMDVAENDKHEKQFLLAQSFMPAQNIQVLQNAPGSYWFSMDKTPGIWYGELVKPAYLRRFD
ncbi:DUF4846 domain-containing protein [Mucilaginibacter ginsenosidivorans]|uniref:DUF4846 domain-containing protein n=1 Tax=Mucilaginibacter ginsenosidivorans TaxID=398053 RepID=A0A5B8UUI1_9SPHI|nr:DUF4846 domain-containing protein [Mucilaginibacter ginsenosidivorans]QEC62777.1 hypothetical protein FRZ54_09335 [Mucilaginibacter ginsenosidivorans]